MLKSKKNPLFWPLNLLPGLTHIYIFFFWLSLEFFFVVSPGGPEASTVQLENPEGPGEVTVTVRDDGEADPLEMTTLSPLFTALNFRAERSDLQLVGVHQHGPDGDVAVRAHPHHLDTTVQCHVLQ